jgi:hypothetical protein
MLKKCVELLVAQKSGTSEKSNYNPIGFYIRAKISNFELLCQAIKRIIWRLLSIHLASRMLTFLVNKDA